MAWSTTEVFSKVAALAALLAIVASGCSATSSDDQTRPASCKQLLRHAVELERSGASGNGHDDLSSTIQALTKPACSQQYAIFTDYSSSSIMVEQIGRESCKSWKRYIHPAAIRLLLEDGLCRKSGEANRRTRSPGLPDASVPWQEALSHLGETTKVCGPLASSRRSDDDYFLNVGRDYPDPDRFTIVLWDVGSVSSPPPGLTVCATGPITSYEGTAQIQLRSVDAVEFYE